MYRLAPWSFWACFGRVLAASLGGRYGHHHIWVLVAMPIDDGVGREAPLGDTNRGLVDLYRGYRAHVCHRGPLGSMASCCRRRLSPWETTRYAHRRAPATMCSARSIETFGPRTA